MRRRLMLLVFPPLVFISPILEAFGTLSLPFFSWPSAAVVGSLFALGLLLGGVAACLLPSDSAGFWRESAFVLTLAVIALVLVDVAVGGHGLLRAVAPGSWMTRVALVLPAAAGIFGLMWIVRRHAAPLFCLCSCAFFISTVALNTSIFAAGSAATPLPPASPASTDRPAFLYVVLDGAMGVEGLNAAPGGRTLAKEIRELFDRYGFRVHGAAFSRHFVSARSIPNTLNFDFRDDSWGPLLRHHRNLQVRSALFSRLARDAYDVISYGTGHIDFCFDVASRCEVLPSFNPFSPYIESDELKTRALYQVMAAALGESYFLYRYSKFLLTRVTATDVSEFAGVDAYAFPRWFERFESDVVSLPRGRAYFAHVLMPHAPYVFDESCRETGRASVAYFLREQHNLQGSALEETRARGYRDYQAQYRCLLSKMEGLLRAFEVDSRFADATIVIHGDHGPRISSGQYVERLTERDMVDNYSTLYAIRAPGLEPGYDTRLVSVQQLTAEYFGGEDLEPGPAVPTVVVDSEDEGKVEVLPMPSFAAVAAQGVVERVIDDASNSQ